MIKGLLKKKERERERERDINKINFKDQGRMLILTSDDIVGINDEEGGLMFEIEK